MHGLNICVTIARKRVLDFKLLRKNLLNKGPLFQFQRFEVREDIKDAVGILETADHLTPMEARKASIGCGEIATPRL